MWGHSLNMGSVRRTTGSGSPGGSVEPHTSCAWAYGCDAYLVRSQPRSERGMGGKAAGPDDRAWNTIPHSADFRLCRIICILSKIYRGIICI